MFTQAEIEYIQKQLARGLTSDAITNKLIETGWDKDDIEDGLKEVERISSLSASLTPNKVEEPIKTEVVKIAEEKNDDVSLPPIIGLETKPGPSVVSIEKESIFPNANRPIEPKAILKVFIGVVLSLLILGGIAFAYYQFFYLPNTKEFISVQPTLDFESNKPTEEIDEFELIDNTVSPSTMPIESDTFSQPEVVSTATTPTSPIMPIAPVQPVVVSPPSVSTSGTSTVKQVVTPNVNSSTSSTSSKAI